MKTMAPEVEEMLARCAAAAGVPAEEITGPRRTRAVTWGRFLAIHTLSRRFPWWSLVDLAEAVGRSDHGTALAGLRRYRELHASEPDFRKMAEGVMG